MEQCAQLFSTHLRGQRSVRLICLQGALSADEDIRFSLQISPLDKCPAYDAISYAWEGQIADRTVLANGMPFLVTKNVEAILRRLRPQTQNNARYLWIDAICINQYDMVEKADQVVMMPDIYGNATSVDIWLGGGSEATDVLFTYIYVMGYAFLPYTSIKQYAMRLNHRSQSPGIGYKISKLVNLWSFVCSLFLVVFLWPALTVFNILKGISNETASKLQTGRTDITARQYWKRTWTVQEVISNPSCVLYCGSARPVNLVLFKIAWELMPWLWSSKEEQIVMDHPLTMHMISTEIYRPPFMTLMLHLDGLANLRSSLLLDRIFGLRALFPTTFGTVDVDYSRTASSVFTDAARAILHQFNFTEILCHAGHQTNPDFPSWVPDWKHQNPFHSDDVANSTRYVSTLLLDVNATKFSCSLLEDEQEPGILRLKGLLIDAITEHCTQPLVIDVLHGVSLESRYFVNVENLRQAISLVRERLIAMPVLQDQQSPPFNQFAALFAQHSNIKVSEILAWLDKTPAEIDYLSSNTPSEGFVVAPKLRRTIAIFVHLTYKKCLFLTEAGRLGIAPVGQTEDRIVLLSGSRMPYLIRRNPNANGRYNLVTPCYINGVMDGQLWPLPDYSGSDEPRVEELDIIELV